MRILIYGAGVQGSYLAHVLLRAGNDVTLLARGTRLQELQKDGIVIRHYLQRKTTVDKAHLISTLHPDDVYDLIFVVMKYSDFEAVLPALAANHSRSLALIGNNADIRVTQTYLEQHSVVEKQIAFGFLYSGGRRENGRIICLRTGGRIDLGSLDGSFSWQSLIKQAFKRSRYKLVFYDASIDLWLKSHMIPMLVLGYATYVCGGNLYNAATNTKLLRQMVDAIDEGYAVLEALGYTIIPAGQLRFFRTWKRTAYQFVKLYTLLPLARFTDPPAQSLEILALHDAFKVFKQQAQIVTPNWDILAQNIPDSVSTHKI